MPRQPRLDAPGALHHVMGRGLERTPIFASDGDRADSLGRLVDLCRARTLSVYAWVFQRWATFVRDHDQALAACDFCVVANAALRVLHVLAAMEVGRLECPSPGLIQVKAGRGPLA